MRKIYLTLISLLLANTAAFAYKEAGFIYPDEADCPKLRTSAPQINDFVPPGWIVLHSAHGDLNGDSLTDTVLVVKGNKAKFKQKNNNMGVDIFDTNLRLMLVLFKERSGNVYKLAESNDNMVRGADFPTMDEPLDGVSIKRGVLNVNRQLFLNAGGWGASKTTYRFKWIGNRFVLIGADKHELQRNTGEESYYSYNFLTRKMNESHGNMGDINGKRKTVWKTIPGGQTKPMKLLTNLNEWQVMTNHYL